MNTIVTLKRLVELVAKEAACEQSVAENFIKAFTAQVRDSLAEGEELKIKGIGTFSVVGNKIVYQMDAELADAVNEPFAIFSPEELAPGMEEADLQKPYEPKQDEPSQPEPMLPESKAEEQLPEPKEEEQLPSPKEEASLPEPMKEDLPEPEPEKPAEPALPAIEEKPIALSEISVSHEPSEASEEPSGSSESSVAPEEPEGAHTPAEVEQPRRPSMFWLVWAAVVGLIVGFAVGFLVHDPIERLLEPSLAEAQEEEEPDISADETADTAALSVAVVEEEPLDTAAAKADEPVAPVVADQPAVPVAEEKPKTVEEVTDQIRTGYTLAKMAKKHYGANEYWVYIYYENKDRIKNPNRIDIGTELRIPPLEKYATQSSEEERRAVARKKVGEVLAKYPN